MIEIYVVQWENVRAIYSARGSGMVKLLKTFHFMLP